MMRARYAGIFALAVLALSVGGMFAFQRIESNANEERSSTATALLPADSVSFFKPFIPIAPDSAAYARYQAEDAAWRQRNARQYTLGELRARGDGTRSAAESMHDRVFEYTRRGERAQAIAELERWVARHPGDERALLSLARLLNEAGRNSAAVERYRQLLAVKQRNGNQE